MVTQWYPGHMNKARRAIAEAMSSTDVVIEVLDARMPFSSANPVIDELGSHKPRLRVLAKSDLADPKITEAWIRFFERANDGRNRAVALTTSKISEARAKVPALCKQLAPNRNGPHKVVRALIVGIPNVGKSTLINTLMERKVAKTGDEPAVTKGQQKVTLKNGMLISDNPGILWPTMDLVPTMRLALGGAIPDTALDYESVALFGAAYFLARYPREMCARFNLGETPESPTALLDAIGRKRGALRAGGVVDIHKAADALVHEFRTGKLGRISLEAPSDFGASSNDYDDRDEA